jgi:hypothetical protein
MPIDQQWTAALWGVGLGATFIASVWLVVANAWFRKATADRIPTTDVHPDPIGTVDEYPEGLGEAHGRVTLFLKAYIVLFVVWSIGYIYIFLTTPKQ